MRPGPAVRLFEALLRHEEGASRPMPALTTEEVCALAGVMPGLGRRTLMQMLGRGDVVSIRYGYSGGRVWRLSSERLP